MLKQPTAVILLVFLVSVIIIVSVGKRPRKRTTIAGNTLKDITRNKINKTTFWNPETLDGLFFFNEILFSVFISLPPNK